MQPRLLENGAAPKPEARSAESYEREIVGLAAEIETLKRELEDERRKGKSAASAIKAIQKHFKAEFMVLRAVFGEIEAIGLGDDDVPAQRSGGSLHTPLDSSRYAPWKEKFKGQTAAAIDILVMYEAGLTRKQLASFLKVAPGSGTLTDVIYKLNRAELIEKDGKVVRLRRI